MHKEQEVWGEKMSYPCCRVFAVCTPHWCSVAEEVPPHELFLVGKKKSRTGVNRVIEVRGAQRDHRDTLIRNPPVSGKLAYEAVGNSHEPSKWQKACWSKIWYGGLGCIAAMLQQFPRRHVSPWGTVTAGTNPGRLVAATGMLRTPAAGFWTSPGTRDLHLPS